VQPREWAPRDLVVVEEIPQLPTGKADRVAIRELAARG
jgi:O-succinylbenzoic acid--CoA ligase